MEQPVSKSEKVTNLLLGFFFIVAGIICLLLGFSFLPLIGGIIGIPCIGIGIFFLLKHKRRLSAGKRSPAEQ